VSLSQLQKDIKKVANPARAKVSQGFFKTGRGQYGEGDVFIGITVPQSRLIARKYFDLSLGEIETLLKSKIHEERLVALLILVFQFEHGDEPERKKIFDFYRQQTAHVNNWDLVDLSADKIVGRYLFSHPKEKTILRTLAKSTNLWERRIAIVATFWFIKNNEFADTFKIAVLLLKDNHDLIHKAVGWMLREVGKRSETAEKNFLKKYYKIMPRTMLRYAIERFPPSVRQAYLRGR
jgi:3-methyladenine DNA glycosylase AlkD